MAISGYNRGMDRRLEGSWNDWRWQLERFRSVAAGGLPATPYYASLASGSGGGAVRSQLEWRGGGGERAVSASESDDPLGEEAQSPVPRLIHRYSDRVLFLATNRCAVRCAFCLRGRIWRGDAVDGWDASDAELEEAAVYVERRPEVREVLVSGGDPLVLETPRISRILDRFSSIPSIKIIRVGSRVPVALPMRVDSELAEALAAVPGLWLATHFNHPSELTEASRNACRTLVSKGVPVLNQTVLLKGVNDDPDTLVELFSELASERVKPHYLFHVDPAPGCADFATGVERALEIVRALRNRLSSVATPTFAIDLPGGGGKVPLLPGYRREDGTFEALDGGGIEYPFK